MNTEKTSKNAAYTGLFAAVAASSCCIPPVIALKWYQTKGFLIGITLFAAISISFPYYAHIFYPNNNNKEVVVVSEANMQTLNFDIEGMTCSGCAAHVENEVNKLSGVISVTASYENENATVTFDKSKTTKKDIVKAINSTGYKVINN